MSDTPRTDEYAYIPCKECIREKQVVVPADFARQLERELVEMKKANAQLHAMIQGFGEVDYLQVHPLPPQPQTHTTATGGPPRWVKLEDGYWGYRITEEEFQKMPK